jgi:cyclic pyranopterin phosphate synthase
MVDVSEKGETERRAIAGVRVRIRKETLDLALSGRLKKGPVVETARLAGIQAAKKTAELIPLCHPLRLSSVEVDIARAGDSALDVTAEVRAVDRTGVEMEALTAAAVAALTLYDMVKASDRGVVISDLRLHLKSGGRSGTFVRSEASDNRAPRDVGVPAPPDRGKKEGADVVGGEGGQGRRRCRNP